MPLPEPYEEEEEEPAPQDDALAGPGPVVNRDWLVDSDEALASEFGRGGDGSEQVEPEPGSGIPTPRSQPRGPRPPNPYEGFAESAAGRASSERWLETGHSLPPAARAQTEWTPEEAAAPDGDFSGPETPTAAVGRARALPLAAPKPWWELLLARARSPLGLLVVAVGGIAIVAVVLLSRPKDVSVPLSKIRHDTARYDGQQVTVRGKVGEVYPVGGGYSFYLLRGRDTIVVFTRSRTPVRDENVSVTGVVSTGALNGEVRQALLENSP